MTIPASRHTRLLRVDATRPGGAAIAEAAAVLRAGGLVAFPTETVYGLGANALCPVAIAGVFAAKGRPADNPLIVHTADAEGAEELAARWPEAAGRAAAAFWPGPLTVVVPARPGLPPSVTAGLPTVALRVPDHPVAHTLLAAAGVPVAAPSANRSGRPSPTRAEHVWDDLRDRIDLIVDGGPVGIGVESTVLDVSVDPPILLRPGGVSLEQLRAVLGEVEVDPGAMALPGSGEVEPGAAVRSPGMKYRHYAPRCPAILVEGEPEARARRLASVAADYAVQGLCVGIIATEEGAAAFGPEQEKAADRGNVVVRVTGPRARSDLYAARMFGVLRELERLGCDVILMEGIDTSGIGLAVMNRLRRAAGFRVVQAGEGDDAPSQQSRESSGDLPCGLSAGADGSGPV